MESSVEQKRQENRRKAPNVADIIDTFEEVFGKVKVLAAEDFETGAKFGEFKEIGVPQVR